MRGSEKVDGITNSTDCAAVENEIADNMYQCSERDWLIYNALLEYANFERRSGKIFENRNHE